MCGIYGCIGRGYDKIEEGFNKNLRHRGPDDQGVYYDHSNRLCFGHRRLSILDLSSRGHQPMTSKDGRYTLVFNGEIYNYRTIKEDLESRGYLFNSDSDSEVVLNSYIEYGDDCPNMFRGMFAFTVYDKENQSCFFARDRFGIKPLIYFIKDGNLIFSSELMPLVKTELYEFKLSSDSLAQYLKYGSVLQPNTMFKDVFQVKPGHSLKVDKHLVVTERNYYSYESASYSDLKWSSYEESTERLRHLLLEATRFHMIADVEVGAFLSGGVDSTAVVALMKKVSNSTINTVSVGFSSKTSVVDETDVATATAKLLECNHRNILIDDFYVDAIFDDFIRSIDQPSIDGINTYIVSLETAKTNKVALSGLGGDEIFAGYSHYSMAPRYSEKTRNPLVRILTHLNKLRPNRYTNEYQYYGLDIVHIVDKIRSFDGLSLGLKYGRPLLPVSAVNETSLSSLQKISKYEIDRYLLNTLLRDGDVLSMAHSMEVRPILLDHHLVEYAFSLPDEYKVRNGVHKSIFIDSVRDLIPESVINRRKSGFEMPFAEWMNSILNDRFLNTLNSEVCRNLFDSKLIERLTTKVKTQKLTRTDWLYFILMQWLVTNKKYIQY